MIRLLGLSGLPGLPGLSGCLITLFCLLALEVFALAGCSGDEGNNTIKEARVAFAQKEYLNAEKFYERLLRYEPESADRWEAWNRVAYIALNVRRDEKLAAEVLESMSLEYQDEAKEYEEVLRRLAMLYEEGHHHEGAKIAWQRMLGIGSLAPPARGEALLHLARIYQARLEYGEAKKYLEEAQKLELPSDTKAGVLYCLSMIYADEGKSKDAEKIILQLASMQEAPANLKVQALFWLADLMEDRGELEKSLELFTSIASTYPNPQAVDVRIKYLKERLKK